MPKSVQQPLPPMLLEKDSQQVPRAMTRTKDTQQAQPARDQRDIANVIASQMFDAALTGAHITSGEAAFLFGCSESLVNRMRAANHRERVSFAQLFLLPPTFHLELWKLQDRHFQHGHQVLRDLLEAAGRLAAVGNAR